MAFVIAFILPCGSFVVIESQVPDREDAWVKIAWVVLVFSIVGAITCTLNSLI